MKTLILDNYDSFTYNLFQYVGEVGGNPVVYRNNKIDFEGVRRLGVSHIIISPGPGNPYTKRDVGISEELIDFASRHNIPLLGVCLGHQVLCKHFGATVSQSPSVYHGKASLVHVTGENHVLFALDFPFEAMRYHSLCVEENTLPKELSVSARSDDGIVMAVDHISLPLFGIQFHPESIGTPVGKEILKNFLALIPR